MCRWTTRWRTSCEMAGFDPSPRCACNSKFTPACSLGSLPDRLLLPPTRAPNHEQAGVSPPTGFSVVIASFRDAEVLRQCVGSLRPQCEALGAELIVVRAARESAEQLRELTAGCRVEPALADDDIPRLRGRGLAAATGEWVAVTEDHCVADAGWLAALIAAAGPGADVLGGAMGNAHHARRTDCGAFFSEYGFFGAGPVAPSRPGPPLVTGANVAYHRRIVADVAAWALSGDWENVIHDRLHASGRTFRLVPDARVRQNLHYALGAFAVDRFEHGRDFAATRARSLPAWRRMIFAAATPALPLVLARRIARAVDPAERPHFGRALPATLAFLAAWAAGEATGYLFGHARA